MRCQGDLPLTVGIVTILGFFSLFLLLPLLASLISIPSQVVNKPLLAKAFISTLLAQVRNGCVESSSLRLPVQEELEGGNLYQYLLAFKYNLTTGEVEEISMFTCIKSNLDLEISSLGLLEVYSVVNNIRVVYLQTSTGINDFYSYLNLNCEKFPLYSGRTGIINFLRFEDFTSCNYDYRSCEYCCKSLITVGIYVECQNCEVYASFCRLFEVKSPITRYSEKNISNFVFLYIYPMQT